MHMTTGAPSAQVDPERERANSAQSRSSSYAASPENENSAVAQRSSGAGASALVAHVQQAQGLVGRRALRLSFQPPSASISAVSPNSLHSHSNAANANANANSTSNSEGASSLTYNAGGRGSVIPNGNADALPTVNRFFMAAAEGDVEKVKFFLVRREMSEQDEHGSTVLFHAAWSNQLAVVNLLLTRMLNKDVNLQNKDKSTALHVQYAGYDGRLSFRLFLFFLQCAFLSELISLSFVLFLSFSLIPLVVSSSLSSSLFFFSLFLSFFISHSLSLCMHTAQLACARGHSHAGVIEALVRFGADIHIKNAKEVS